MSLTSVEAISKFESASYNHGKSNLSRAEKRFVYRGKKEQKKGITVNAMHTRKGTEQKLSIYNGKVQQDETRQSTKQKKLRRKSRRAAKENVLSSKLGNVSFSALRKNLKLQRRSWTVEASLHPIAIEASLREDLQWKGKNKLAGRASKGGCILDDEA